MLSFTRRELEEHTKPLCSPGQCRLKLQNYESIEEPFAARAEHCKGLPVLLHIEPSGNCNLTCPICPRGRGLIERTGLLSLERLNWSPSDCTHPWDSVFLSCTGEVGICSFDPYLSVKGLDHGSDFAALWNGDAMRRVRQWHAGENTKVQAPCSKCNRLPGYLVPGS